MKQKMRWPAVLIALVLILTTFPLSAGAIDAGSYYYQQLDAYGKELYDALLSNGEALRTEGNITVKKTNPSEEDEAGYTQAADLALDAFYLDHPEVFWVINSRSSGVTGSIMRNDDPFDDEEPQLVGPWSYTYTMIISLRLGLGCNWESGSRSIKEDETLVNSKVAEVAAVAQAAGSSRYAQVKTVHDWLVANNTYNRTASEGGLFYMLTVDGTPNTPISALDTTLSPVCEGYSRAFKLICDWLGIPCILVSGQLSGGSHMWNYIQMEDGNWYAEDVTNNRFLFGSDDSASYSLDTDWQYPTLSKTSCQGPVTQSSGPSKFTDVTADAYYAAPVTWAVAKGITNGTSATTFSPNQTCTRGQIITFLWRAAGSPEPGSASAFTDVKTDAYYAKATAWAAENGMASGNTFSPDAPCTRLMAVEFMWKLAESPSAAAASFSDVSSDAVNWAVAKGVTNGTSDTTFSPDATCTRGQIVTFLYRGFAE